MKAAILRAPYSTPVYREFAEPPVSGDTETGTLVATGIHPIVRALAKGEDFGSTPRWPIIPGIDAVARMADGSLVYTGYIEPPYGTIAERMAVPTALRLPIPAGADAVGIAGGTNPGLSSWMPLSSRLAEVASLGTVLIVGATGTAGALAVQNAFVLGATRVVGVGRNRAGLDRAQAFGAVTVPFTGDRTSDAMDLAAVLGDETPTIVLDFVWGAPAEATLRALGHLGAGHRGAGRYGPGRRAFGERVLDDDAADLSYVQLGSRAGEDAAVPASLLRSRHIRITGSGAGSVPAAELMAQLPRYLQLIADGTVTVYTQSYPLSHITEAWKAAGSTAPRPVVVPDAA